MTPDGSTGHLANLSPAGWFRARSDRSTALSLEIAVGTHVMPAIDRYPGPRTLAA
jgi:hypothetical protein